MAAPDRPPAAASVTTSPSVMTRYGSRISRDAVLYFLGTAMVLPLSLVNVAVFTRFLDPSEYGDLAVLFVFASSLTVLWNLLTLQGTFLWVFGAGEDAEMATDESRQARGGTKRRALGTGALLTLLTVLLGTGAMLLVGEELRRALVGEDQGTGALRWALISGASGSLFRFAVGVPRFERRPVRFAMLNLLRPALALAIAIPLIVRGNGVEGALAGTAIGTLLACTVAFAVQARSYAFALDRGDARRIIAISASYTGLVVGLWAAHNVDILMLARYATDDEVGVYRLAARMGAIVSYAVGAFLVAWSPLERTSLFAATYASLGRPHVRGQMVTYYFVIVCWLVLAMSLGADVLVQIAPAEYAAAAGLVPLVAVGLALYGLFTVLGRTTPMRRRGLTYGGSAVGSALILVGTCPLFIPWLGPPGAALALIVGMGAGCGFLAVLAWRARAMSLKPLRLALLVALTGGLYALALAGADFGVGRVLLDVLTALIVFPAAVVGLRIVPIAHVRPLMTIARAALLGDTRPRTATAALEALDPQSRAVLAAVLRDGRSVHETAALLGVGRDETRDLYLGALCRLAGIAPFADDGRAVSDYLLSEAPVAERDVAFGRLERGGVDPLAVHELENFSRRLRKLSRRRWPSDLGPTGDGVSVRP